MTFAESLEFVTQGKCVYRDWWQRDYGTPVIGLHRGTLMRFRFDKWDSYHLTEIDIDATDWEVVPDAPTFDELLQKVDSLKESLTEKEEFGCQKLVGELREMIRVHYAENKRNKE